MLDDFAYIARWFWIGICEMCMTSDTNTTYTHTNIHRFASELRICMLNKHVVSAFISI